MENAKVSVIMGSKSDLPVMQDAIEVLKYLGVAFELTIVSAHRTPKRMFDFAEQAASWGSFFLF
jgi:5-(carboxyamino)imidazole ribonucleotide mutase